jgi:hypothetical protein
MISLKAITTYAVFKYSQILDFKIIYQNLLVDHNLLINKLRFCEQNYAPLTIQIQLKTLKIFCLF